MQKALMFMVVLSWLCFLNTGAVHSKSKEKWRRDRCLDMCLVQNTTSGEVACNVSCPDSATCEPTNRTGDRFPDDVQVHVCVPKLCSDDRRRPARCDKMPLCVFTRPTHLSKHRSKGRCREDDDDGDDGGQVVWEELSCACGRRRRPIREGHTRGGRGRGRRGSRGSHGNRSPPGSEESCLQVCLVQNTTSGEVASCNVSCPDTATCEPTNRTGDPRWARRHRLPDDVQVNVCVPKRCADEDETDDRGSTPNRTSGGCDDTPPCERPKESSEADDEDCALDDMFPDTPECRHLGQLGDRPRYQPGGGCQGRGRSPGGKRGGRQGRRRGARRAAAGGSKGRPGSRRRRREG